MKSLVYSFLVVFIGAGVFGLIFSVLAIPYTTSDSVWEPMETYALILIAGFMLNNYLRNRE